MHTKPARRRTASVRFWYICGLLLACAGFLTPALRAETAVEEAPPVAPPTTAEPKLPAGIEPLSADLKAKMDKLKAATVKFRGLDFKTPVAIGQLGREALKTKVLGMFKEEMPPEKLNPMQQTYKEFGLIPEKLDLNVYYPELLTSSIGGFYDPKEKYLVLIKEVGEQRKKMVEMVGAKMADKMDEVVVVHELTHAIQDQHFDLQKFGVDTPLSDESAARLALVEGDATLVMYSHMLGKDLERMPGVEKSMAMYARDPKKMAEMMPDMPGSKEMAEAPAVLRDNLLFSYVQGVLFAIQVRKAGGQKLFDYAFRTDRPSSTEQILHPEKWITERDDPTQVTMPDLATQLPGYAKVQEGTWGEFGTRILLSEHLGEAKRAECDASAAGWGGDRFAVYEKGDARVTVWITEWDSTRDAQEFMRSGMTGLVTKGWSIDAPATTRVTLIQGKLEEPARLAVQKALAGARAVAGANRKIDLAALGITAADKPKSLSIAEMQDLAQNTDIQQAMGSIDLEKMLDDPDMLKMIGDMAKEVGGDNPMLEGLDMAEMLKNPMVKEMMKKMLDQPAPPKGKLEEGGWVNEKLGLKLKQPTAAGWSLDANPEKPPMGPAPLVQLKGPKEGVGVALVQQALPMAVPIEMMPMSLEMGMKMQMKDFKKVKAGFVETNGKKGYRLECSGTMMGEQVHLIQQVYIVDQSMLMLMATAPQAEWADHEKAIKEALDGLAFTGAGQPAAPAAPEKQQKNEPQNDQKERLQE